VGSTIRPSSPAGVSAARFLARASQATGIIFAVSAASMVLPLSLLAPGWQHQQIATLVNNGVIALLSLVLMAVAHALDPRNSGVKLLLGRFRRWAAAAALGYLLLVPLAIYSLGGQIEIEQRQVLRQREQVSRRYDAMGDLIARAPTVEALRLGLIQMDGPVLGAADLAEPLPALRRRLRVLLKQGRSQVLEQVKPVDPARRMLMVRETVRLAVSSLVFAAAFAAGASHGESSGSLLGVVLRRAAAIGYRFRAATAKPSPSTPDKPVLDDATSSAGKVPVRTRRRRRVRPS
jgi:hypothetical protein